MKLFSYFTVLINCFSILYPQDSSVVSHSSFREHPWALEFGIAQNLTLRDFQGSAVSLSRFVSKNEKVRLGISPSFYSRNSTSTYLQGDTLPKSYTSTEQSGSIDASLQYLSYESPIEDISFFFAVGPIMQITWHTYQEGSPFNVYSIGILGSCGAEWFVSRRIGIHAEYGLSARYTRNKYETSTTSSSISNVWEVNGRDVLFGLSAYF